MVGRHSDHRTTPARRNRKTRLILDEQRRESLVHLASNESRIRRLSLGIFESVRRNVNASFHPAGPESRTFRTPRRKLMADSARLISPFLPLFPSWMINEASIRSLRFANASSRLLRRVAILITNFSLPFSRSIRSRLSDQRRSFLLIDQTRRRIRVVREKIVILTPSKILGEV